ncbi:mitochondrial carrier homolog 2-like [Prorops nasuta]|uniref:mitochondrial carrier homolog 2-like n=1 Tax=Prorops nasuta TaxID=863751 RepID=UPI0034CDDAEF
MVPSKDESLWSGIASRMLLNTIAHPIEYAKVLIQIGHEPIPPKPTTTLFGKPALGLPNVFKYVKYIKSVDGFTGCYRGLVPKLCAYTVSAIAFDKTTTICKSITLKYELYNEKEDDELTESERRSKCVFKLIRDLISRIVGIIISHPFDVIALRIMAQFVGRENKYNGLLRSFGEVYRENGIMGYYAGIIPRIIGNAAVLIMVSASTYAINKYFISDHDINTESAMTFLATTVTYPCLLVSHCMAVNNSGLAAGCPPNMPIYNNWLDCWRHLSSVRQLNRGSSLLWRYYPGPQVIINGVPMPINNVDLKMFKKI